MFARAGLIDILIKNLREYSEKSNLTIKAQQFDLNKNEVIATLQIAIVAHIMMFIEDLAVICKSISEGNIGYYKYLDKPGDQDLGEVISNFYSEIESASDETLSKILSYTDVNDCEFVLEIEREIISKIRRQMIEKARAFLNRVIMFRANHIKIFRRYKHAGFPILLAQQVPSDIKAYEQFQFASLGLTSREEPAGEIVPLPYSAKAIESYENLKKDIFSFLGNVITYKLICIERKVHGLFPNNNNLWGLVLSEDEKKVLDNVWERFNAKFPVPEGQTPNEVITYTEVLRWYEDIENTSKRVL